METRELHEAKVRPEEQGEIGANEEDGKEYIRMWLCDVCKTELFKDYDEAVVHEENCQGLIEGGVPTTSCRQQGGRLQHQQHEHHQS